MEPNFGFTSKGKPYAIIDASELGFPPGSWPLQVTVQGVVFNRKNVRHANGGDIASWSYADADGRVMEVFND